MDGMSASAISQHVDFRHALFVVSKRSGRPRQDTQAPRPNRIEQLRLDRGWSMEELAQRCVPATTAATINKLEKGQVKLTFEWAHKLSRALEVHPYDLRDDPALSPREQAMLRIFRGLEDRDQDAVYRHADGLAQSHPKKSTVNGN